MIFCESQLVLLPYPFIPAVQSNINNNGFGVWQRLYYCSVGRMLEISCMILDFLVRLQRDAKLSFFKSERENVGKISTDFQKPWDLQFGKKKQKVSPSVCLVRTR